GDVTQAIEVHVRAAVHRDERLAPALLACDVLLDSRNWQCASRLDDGAIVFEDVLNCRTGFVGGDGDDFIDVLARETECLFAYAADGDTVGEDADAIECD